MKKKKSGSRGCLALILGIFLLWAGIQVLAYFVETIKYQRVTIESKEDFFKEYGPLARQIGKKYKLYPSMILGQAALESNFGQSQLSKESHNYFGIKAQGKGGMSYATKEYENGKEVEIQDRFETYKNPVDSFKHYGKLLGQAKRYEPVVEAQSLRQACQLLHPCGYSTDPSYGDRVLELIDQYDLETYDQGIK